DTLVLETEFTVDTGRVRVTDCMPPRDTDPVLVRLVEGLSGRLDLRMTLGASFEYGSAEPRVQRHGDAYRIPARAPTLGLVGPPVVGGAGAGGGARPGGGRAGGPRGGGGHRGRSGGGGGAAGEKRRAPPRAPAVIDQTARWWRDWAAGLTYAGEWREPVIRS